jgi:AraC family transcriptional regulator
MKHTTQADYAERILRVLVHIQQHLDETFDLEELARLACFSPFQFHRIFRGMTGEPVHAHVRRLRLERAARQLLESNKDVLSIALDAGYESQEAFSRAFRSRFDVAPASWRRAQRELRSAPNGVVWSTESRVDGFRAQTCEGKHMDAKIEKRDPLRVAFLRHVGPYSEVGSVWARLCAALGPRGLLGPDAIMLGASYDDPEITAAEKLRYDACVTVDGNLQPEGDLGIQELRGGDYAMTLHRGPYEDLAQTYAVLLGQWLPERSREPDPSAPCLEFYKNDPSQVPPEELLTEICVPLL